MTLYNNLFRLPFGLVTDASVRDIDMQAGSFQLQNQLYALLADDGPLLETPEGEAVDGRLTFFVTGRKYLYYQGGSGSLTVNGEPVPGAQHRRRGQHPLSRHLQQRHSLPGLFRG